MSAEEFIPKVQKELQNRFKAAGRGAVSRVQKELNLGAGYFRDLRRSERQRFDLRVLGAALETLDVDFAEFFNATLGTSSPLQVFQAEALRLRHQIKRLPQILISENERCQLSLQPTEVLDLKSLDVLRRENPRQMIRQSQKLILRAVDHQVPSLLGITASAYRTILQQDEAQIILGHALTLAEQAEDLPTLGDLLQRCAYVAANQVDHEQALRLTDQALLTHIEANHPIGIGKALLDQGAWLGRLGRGAEACAAYHRSLQFVSADSPEQDEQLCYMAALFNLGFEYKKLGHLDQARAATQQARENCAAHGPSILGKVLWLEASIAKDEERFDQSSKFLAEAIGLYRDIDPLVTAALTVDLVKVDLLQGKADKAYETARAMTTLLQPLAQNRFATIAITELLRCALAGRGLTIEMLNKVAKNLTKSRGESS